MLQKGFASIVMILVLVVVGASALIIFYKRSATTSMLQSPGPFNTNIPRVTPTPLVGSISKPLDVLTNKLILATPRGWKKTICESSVNFDPTFGGCATEPNRFAINVFTDTPAYFEGIKSSFASEISNINTSQINGRNASAFIRVISEGQAEGTYKYTIIHFDANTDIIFVLNNSDYVTEYTALLSTLSFKGI